MTLRRCVGLLLLGLCTGGSLKAGGPVGDVELGRRIFEHNWARPGELDDAWGEGGDGLGPLFNDVSCVACHGVGGTGGAGANERNAVLLSLVSAPPRRWRAEVPAAVRAGRIHFEFADSTSIVLHKFGFGSDGAPLEYDEWLLGLLDSAEPPVAPAAVTPSRFSVNGLDFELAQRNTPALWGAGIIDALARVGGDRVREEIRVEQGRKYPWLNGRVPRTSDGGEGWFGWRGQTGNLHDFVLGACALELGLEVPGHSQPASPTSTRRERKLAARDRALDLTDAQCRSLTAFISRLPRPEQVLPESPGELAMVRAGEEVFERVGCASCHVPRFGTVEGFYSDLLLHDMGPALADRVSAHPDPSAAADRRMTNVSAGYYGGSGSSLVAREWRTPPLWGVADSAPYLHDGRAETLDEAIRLHGGAADRARSAYEQLDRDERWSLLAFLESLRAPAAE